MEDKENPMLFTTQLYLSRMDEDEMVGTISLFLAWEIARRTMNINETLSAFNYLVQRGVRDLLGIPVKEDDE